MPDDLARKPGGGKANSKLIQLTLPPSFLDTCNICHLSDVRFCASSLSFFSSWSICWSSSLIHSKNGPKYLTMGGGGCPGVNLFDEIPAAELDFEKFSHSSSIYVIYWTWTEPSINRCTCVNKWRNSGSWWAWDNYITRCHRQLGSVLVGVGVGVGASWRQDAEVRGTLF